MSPLPDRRHAALALVAAGLGLIGAGLAAAGVLTPPEPAAVVVASPTLIQARTPAPSPTPSASPTAAPLPTPTPRTAVATRVRIGALRIDLPVVRDNEGYPLCDVAMYSTLLGQPGQGRATYLSAHARRGMFYPIYERVILRGDPGSLLGMGVKVWASDGLRFEYEIVEVRTKQRSVLPALLVKEEQLWLQTSEGPPGTKGVTQVIARLVRTLRDPAGASPSPRPRECR